MTHPRPSANGREEIARFHRWMRKFAPDSFDGALRLPDGSSVQSTGATFSVPGVAARRYDANGELPNHRDYWDLNALLSQVGAVPEKPHLPA